MSDEKKAKRHKQIDTAFGHAKRAGEPMVEDALGEEIEGIPTAKLWSILCCCCKKSAKLATDRYVTKMEERKKEKEKRENSSNMEEQKDEKEIEKCEQ